MQFWENHWNQTRMHSSQDHSTRHATATTIPSVSLLPGGCHWDIWGGVSAPGGLECPAPRGVKLLWGGCLLSGRVLSRKVSILLFWLLVDPRDGRKRSAPFTRSNFFHFHVFLGKKWPNNRLAPCFGVDALRLGNTGFATTWFASRSPSFHCIIRKET